MASLQPYFMPCPFLVGRPASDHEEDLHDNLLAQKVLFFQADSIFGFKPGKCQFSAFEDTHAKALRIILWTKEGDVYCDVISKSDITGQMHIYMLDEPHKCIKRDIGSAVHKLFCKMRRLPEWIGFSAEVEVDLNGGLKVELTPTI